MLLLLACLHWLRPGQAGGRLQLTRCPSSEQLGWMLMWLAAARLLVTAVAWVLLVHWVVAVAAQSWDTVAAACHPGHHLHPSLSHHLGKLLLLVVPQVLQVPLLLLMPLVVRVVLLLLQAGPGWVVGQPVQAKLQQQRCLCWALQGLAAARPPPAALLMSCEECLAQGSCWHQGPPGLGHHHQSPSHLPAWLNQQQHRCGRCAVLAGPLRLAELVLMPGCLVG